MNTLIVLCVLSANPQSTLPSRIPQCTLPERVRGKKPAARECPCSPACTCGCNEGEVCECGNTLGSVTSPQISPRYTAPPVYYSVPFSTYSPPLQASYQESRTESGWGFSAPMTFGGYSGGFSGGYFGGYTGGYSGGFSGGAGCAGGT